MKIALLFRKKTDNKFSIEELFRSIFMHMKRQETDIARVETAYSRATIKSVLSNLRSFNSASYDLVHITGDVNYMILACKCPCVITIHDVGSFLKGNFIKKLLSKIVWIWIPAILAKRITVISEYSKLELLRLIPFVKDKIRVINNPISPLIEENFRKFNSECPIILQVGTKDNKNLERSILALEGLKCEYLIIGKLKDAHLKLLTDCSIKYKNMVNISYEKIIECYQLCDIVLFASLYEGFGMPIIEAQKTGRVVITSKISSMPEIAGIGSCLVNPYSIVDIRNALNKIIIDDTYRENILRAGTLNVKRFNINYIVKQYLAVYKEILLEPNDG